MDPPPAKRLKKSECNGDETNDSDPSYLMNQLQPVLHAHETRGVELVPVYIAEVSNLKLISSIIAYVGSRYPLGTLSHLKRIRKVQKEKEDAKSWTTHILIGLITSVHSADEIQTLNEKYGLSLEQYQVPRYEPLMKAQYESWTKIWPITLKAHIPSTPAPQDSFSIEQVRNFATHMRSLIELTTNTGNSGNACAILSPAGTLITTATSTQDSPLSHCCINAINFVAEEQLKNSTNVQHTHQKRSAVADASEPHKPLEYLCTGDTALLVREPCIMCSMALLHSRISCVIYAVSNPTSGGLGSRFSIHCEPQLNHHFHVYKGFLAENVASNGN